MCLIIDKPKGILFPEDDLKTAIEVNHQGFGLMWADQGAVRFLKTDKYTPDQIVKAVEKLKNHHALFHLRFNTVGDTNQENCHPFKILDRRVHGNDLFLMHNGTISKCQPDYKATPNRKALSDTKIFSHEVLRPLLDKFGYEALEDPIILELLEDYIGSTSKIVLLGGDGNVIKLNGDKGSEKHGCWVSNTYSFNSNHRKPTTVYQGRNGSYLRPVRTKTGPNGTWEWPYQKEAREKSEKEEREKNKKPGPPLVVITEDKSEKIENKTKGKPPFPIPASKPATGGPKENSLPFEDLSELDYFLNNISYLSREDIEYFVYDNPDEAVELIYELGQRI